MQAEVLDMMMQRTTSSIQSLERSMVGNRITRAQVQDHVSEHHDAIKGFMSQLSICQDRIKALERELEGMDVDQPAKVDDEEDVLEGEEITWVKQNIRLWREMEHKIWFFSASSYYGLNKNREEPVEEWALKEVEYYKKAEDCRTVMLKELSDSFEKNVLVLVEYFKKMPDDLVELVPLDLSGGIATETLFEEISKVEEILSSQWDFIEEWIEKLYETLKSPLNGDKPEGEAPTGEEYEYGIEKQATAKAFQDELLTLLEVRRQVLTAEARSLMSCDHCQVVFVKGFMTKCAHKFCTKCVQELKDEAPAVKKRKRFECPSCYTNEEYFDQLDEINQGRAGYNILRKRPLKQTELQLQLFEQVKELDLGTTLNSYKAYIQKFKSISSRSNELPKEEIQLAHLVVEHMQEQLTNQLKNIDTLKNKFLLKCKETHNSREKYYSHLNVISDTVNLGSWEEEDLPSVMEDLTKKYSEFQTKLSQDIGKLRYFNHLKSLSKEEMENEQRICTVCHSDISEGSITECGHVTCQSCVRKWIMLKKKCSVCNQAVNPRLLTKLTFKATGAVQQSDAIKEKLEVIRKIKLLESYGSKLDMIVRHICSLVEEDPNVKILLFSQWDAVLKIMAEALIKQGISHIFFEGSGWKPNTGKISATKKGESVQKFIKTDITCFLLHAKAQSSGLTLVEATHVFLLVFFNQVLFVDVLIGTNAAKGT